MEKVVRSQVTLCRQSAVCRAVESMRVWWRTGTSWDDPESSMGAGRGSSCRRELCKRVLVLRFCMVCAGRVEKRWQDWPCVSQRGMKGQECESPARKGWGGEGATGA